MDLLTSLTGRDYLSIFAVSVTFVVIYQYAVKFRYWKNQNVKGPTPWPLLGNSGDILFGNKLGKAIEWREKYGKMFGVYQGTEHRLYVGDPEVVQQICIKDFDVFPNHQDRQSSNKYQKSFIFNQRDDHWRKLRALMSPTFTSGKIKRMFKMLDYCADDLVDCFKEEFPGAKVGQGSSAVVNVKKIYQLYTMDGIATCCYGLKLDRVSRGQSASARNEFVRVADLFFQFSNYRFLLAVVVPKPILKLFGFSLVPNSQMQPLASIAEGLIQSRRKSGKKFDDYLQLLMETRLDNELELDEMDRAENHHVGVTDEILLDDQKKMVDAVNKTYRASSDKKVTLSDLEVVSGAMFLLSVGLETTGTLLTHCSYALSFHKQIQDRLYDELKKIVEYNDDKTRYRFDYEAVTSCRYLDAVISETLRLLPPIPQIDRQANEDYVIEKYNIRVPKGSCLVINFYGIHMDPDLWPEPLKFNPDRFMPENRDKIVAGSYVPFGIGPRHCIGMRFSLTEAKLALAKILMEFEMKPAPGFQFPPNLSRRPGLNNIKDPMVTLVPRVET